MIGGTTRTSNLAADRYMGMFTAEIGVEPNVQNIMPRAGTVSNFFVFIQAPPAAGRSWTFTVRRNAGDTGVACTITSVSVNNSCSDLLNTAAFNAGDLISIRVSASNPAPTGTPGQWTAQFGP